jgi:hypothetical protein
METSKGKVLLQAFLEKNFKSIQKQLLDIAEFVIPQENYKAFRSKLLGITNDFKRDLDLELTEKYSINLKTDVVSDSIIVIQNSKLHSLNGKERKGE